MRHGKYEISNEFQILGIIKLHNLITILGVVTPSWRLENGFLENGDWGKRGANRIDSPWGKVWHPFVAFSKYEDPVGEKHKACGENSPRIPHSLSTEEKKLGFAFSENGPSAIQGEGATSPFSNLEEWEEGGVTTCIVVCCKLEPPQNWFLQRIPWASSYYTKNYYLYFLYPIQ